MIVGHCYGYILINLLNCTHVRNQLAHLNYFKIYVMLAWSEGPLVRRPVG